jgi:hypothetical protein
MNSRLTSPFYRGVYAQLKDAIVGFDDDGNCIGIVRYATGHPLEEPEQITLEMLDEASEHPHIYRVTDENGEVLEPKSVRDRKAREVETKTEAQELADSEIELVEEAKAVYERPQQS